MEIVIANHFLNKDLVHHPIETTIYKQMAIRFQEGGPLPVIKLGGGNSHIFDFHPEKYLGNRFPIWLAHIFEMGWFNHQPVKSI